MCSFTVSVRWLSCVHAAGKFFKKYLRVQRAKIFKPVMVYHALNLNIFLLSLNCTRLKFSKSCQWVYKYYGNLWWKLSSSSKRLYLKDWLNAKWVLSCTSKHTINDCSNNEKHVVCMSWKLSLLWTDSSEGSSLFFCCWKLGNTVHQVH